MTAPPGRRAPGRVQLRRAKGWRLPDGAVVVARPTKWGNPFRVGTPGIPDRARAVARFAELIEDRRAGRTAPAYPSDARIRAELAGRNLACWCPPGEPCHVDVLLAVANER